MTDVRPEADKKRAVKCKNKTASFLKQLSSFLRTRSMAGADKKKTDTIAIAKQMRDCCFSEKEKVSDRFSSKITHRE